MGLELVPAGKELPDDIYVVIEILQIQIQSNMKWTKRQVHYLWIALWQPQCFTRQTTVM